MDFDSFIDTYNPIKNKLVEDASFCGFMFETYGEEFDFIKNHEQTNSKCVWTIVDGDGENLELVSGIWHVNRIGYIVTEKPYTVDKGDICFIM